MIMPRQDMLGGSSSRAGPGLTGTHHAGYQVHGIDLHIHLCLLQGSVLQLRLCVLGTSIKKQEQYSNLSGSLPGRSLTDCPFRRWRRGLIGGLPRAPLFHPKTSGVKTALSVWIAPVFPERRSPLLTLLTA